MPSQSIRALGAAALLALAATGHANAQTLPYAGATG